MARRTDRYRQAAEALQEAARVVMQRRSADAALHCLIALSHIVSSDPKVGESVQVLARAVLHGSDSEEVSGGG